MLDSSEQNARARYQAVVESIAETRAWGMEWLLQFSLAQFGKYGDADAAARCKELENRLKLAETMVRTDLFKLFFGSAEKMPRSIAEPWEALAEELKALLERMVDFRRAEEPVTPQMIGEATHTVSDAVGRELGAFLRELNRFVANEEVAETGRNAGLIGGALSEIGKINETINLIAVNASVEAARAGAAGRGFSVIASEIQSLSLKSADVFRDLKQRLR